MTMPACALRARQMDQAAVVQVEGRATMNQSSAVRRFAERCLAQGVAAVKLDLRSCSYMDSTFLGTLLYVQRAVKRRGKGSFALVQPSPECSRILEQAGLRGEMPVVAAEEFDPSSWMVLPEEAEDRNSLKGTVLQAHQELAKLPGPTGEVFRGVSQYLESEIAARR